MSGKKAIPVTDMIFRPKGKGGDLSHRSSHTLAYGEIYDGAGEVLDEVVVSLFRAPHSYTGEDTVEISCHGSAYIARRIIERLIDSGCRGAAPGEFTRRAFANGRLDLSQAEAVADLIASTSAASHRVAMNQMRGGFSRELADLRARLLKFVSLIELELDFSEEDVEFADRTQLVALADHIEQVINRLADSFSRGNADDYHRRDKCWKIDTPQSSPSGRTSPCVGYSRDDPGYGRRYYRSARCCVQVYRYGWNTGNTRYCRKHGNRTDVQ